jgi:hypothetical protein
MILTVEVKNCNNCPFAKAHRGHGECWTECTHPDNNRNPYENILCGCNQELPTTPPYWCPILKQQL